MLPAVRFWPQKGKGLHKHNHTHVCTCTHTYTHTCAEQIHMQTSHSNSDIAVRKKPVVQLVGRTMQMSPTKLHLSRPARTTCIRRHPHYEVKDFWEQSFHASIPLLTATNTFGLERRRYFSLWQGYLHRLHTFTIRTSSINLISITVKFSCLYVSC